MPAADVTVRAWAVTSRALTSRAPCVLLPEALPCRGGGVVAGRRSNYVRPGLAVDSGAGGYVADAEFGGQLPVGHAFGSACPQLSDFLVGQLGPGVTLADRAVIGAVAFAAPWLEPDPDVVARGIDRRPVLGRFPAVNTCVTAGWAAGFVNALVPYVIGRVGGLPGDPG